ALLGIASLIAVPLGLLAGIYLAEYGRGRLAGALSLSADVLTGFPSILVGFFVFLSLASLDPRLVTSSYAGGIALAILMLPLVARSTEVALRAVPAHLREAALALGFPKRRVTLRIAIGNSVAGLLTGLLLAIARAGGETAALLMTTGTSLFYARGLSGPTAALPTLIYNDGLSGYPNWQSVAWGATLVLLAGMLGVGLASRWVLRAAPRAGGAP
ncbi:MAG TPA: ABC transporter permease subunit, partial [Thermoplasmata archaeon]|nr:ABC transporter permease subunit [Thermoplasmata archaeon]